jgi:hypothetical protein
MGYTKHVIEYLLKNKINLNHKNVTEHYVKNIH